MTLAHESAPSGGFAKDPVSTISAIAPELRTIIEGRYAVLRMVATYQPIGRRALATHLGWSERITRSEVDLLRSRGLLQLNRSGILLSESGRDALPQLRLIVSELRGLRTLEQRLQALFSLRQVIVVPGDCEIERASRDNLARTTGETLLSLLTPEDVIAVSGGSTLAEVTDRMSRQEQFPSVVVVPTGGGLGDALEIESNTVAVQLAKALGAKYRLLHLPDDLAEASVKALLEAQPAIRDLFKLIRSATVVLRGVGTIESVAARRRFDSERLHRLEQQGAVCESLGYFFSRDGRVVEAGGGVGMRLEDLRNANHVIVVAVGARKAAAIAAMLRSGLEHILITDEAAALAILADNAAAPDQP